MTGRVTPSYGVDDNPMTTGRSLGYGAPALPVNNGCASCQGTVKYASDFPTWVQAKPNSLNLKPIPPGGRIAPDFGQGRSLGYGADLPAGITNYYPGFLKNQLTLPLLGGVMIGTFVLLGLAAFVGYKLYQKKK